MAEDTDRLVLGGAGLPPIVADPSWEGVLRFLVGAHGQKGRDRARAHVQRLHDHAMGEGGCAQHANTGRLLGLVASGLSEYREHFEGHALRQRVPAELVAAFREGGATWPLADRLLALDALGRLGDPRLQEQLWVEIAGATFTMGGDKVAWESAPAHDVTLSTYLIAWRPVTVEDFGAFVKAGGYDEDRWWTAGRADEPLTSPRDWARQLHHPNRPVVGVSWYESKAYCAWASEHLAHPEGGRIDLPTEAEWEYVARGAEGRAYPWGEGELVQGDAARASFGGFQGEGPGHATPVGAYPGGHVGRIVDLAGNVWEWCCDAWRNSKDDSWKQDDKTDPCHLGDSSAPRVLRGGSWLYDARHLRCAGRGRYPPWDRDTNLGFRLVCRVPREHAD